MASTVHLKIRFYSAKDEIITIAADLESAKKCHYLSIIIGHKSDKTEKKKDHT